MKHTLIQSYQRF